MTSNYNYLYVSREYPIEIGDAFTVPVSSEHEWRGRRFNGLKVVNIHYEYWLKVLTFDHSEWLNSNPFASSSITHQFKNKIIKY